MLITTELNEYLEEIRSQVCANCVEKPAAGPPCGPLGKMCGVEQHLPELIDAIHDVQATRSRPIWRKPIRKSANIACSSAVNSVRARWIISW